jgi:gluconolactonase
MYAQRIAAAFAPALLLALGLLALPSTSGAQPQSKNQQKCLNTMNKDGAKVAATQGKENTACIKNAGGGKESDPDACLTRDAKGKVAKAAAKTGTDFAKSCTQEAPDFGLPGQAAGTAAGMVTGTTAAIVNAAIDEEVQLLADVFGASLAGAIATDKSGAKCQAAVSKDYEKTATTYMKGFLGCKKNALKAGADGREDLDACVLDDSRGKAASTVNKLKADIDKVCSENLFPGRCAGRSIGQLGDCIHALVRCGVCRMQNGMDGLRADCDALDDGALNESCTINPLTGIGPVTPIAGGFTFLEGPRWKTDEQVLYFTDVPAARIYRLTLPDTIEIFRSSSGGANGLAFDSAGRLLAAEGASRRVTRTEPGGAITTLADRFEGLRLNSPNDLVVRSDGSIYFTDPASAPPLRELPFNGIFRIAPDGALSVVAQFGPLTYPNGIELSPDESLLYASDSVGPLRVWDVVADGSLSGERVFATPSFGDGMAVDTAGNLYVAASTGVEVYAPDGTHWGGILVEGTPSNCGFGGPDNRTLFITTRPALYSVDMPIAGIP